MSPRAKSASSPTRCGGRTSLRPCPTRRRPARPMIPAILADTSGARRKVPTGKGSSVGARNHARPGDCAASASRPMSKRAATTGPKPHASASMRMAASQYSVGTQSTGQGHATAYAQIVADHLDLAPERVRVIQGDTDLIATGAGTGGSSSIPCGGASVAGATKKLAAKLKEIAADALEAAASDLEIAEGAVHVAGTDRMISFADLARRPEARRRAALGRGRFRARGSDLSQRHPSRRGRDRSGDRRNAASWVTGWSTISE